MSTTFERLDATEPDPTVFVPAFLPLAEVADREADAEVGEDEDEAGAEAEVEDEKKAGERDRAVWTA